MRKVFLFVCCLLLSATVAMAQGKVDNQWNCPKATAAHSLDAPDQANHSYAISQVGCTASKGEIAGVKEKEGAAVQFNEGTGNATKWHGMFVVTMENGDKVHYSYKGTGTAKDGQFASGNNTWSIVGGTGKFKGAKGNGACKGTGSADGSAVWECTGTYKLVTK